MGSEERKKGPAAIIAFAGQAGSGKTTAAEMVALETGGVRVSFARALKRGVLEMFGLTEDDVTDTDLKESPHLLWGFTPRQLLQEVGTIMKDHFGPEFWTRRLAMDLTRPEFDGVVLTIDDVRFPWEVEWLESLDVPSLVVGLTAPEDSQDPHASEHALKREGDRLTGRQIHNAKEDLQDFKGAVRDVARGFLADVVPGAFVDDEGDPYSLRFARWTKALALREGGFLTDEQVQTVREELDLPPMARTVVVPGPFFQDVFTPPEEEEP